MGIKRSLSTVGVIVCAPDKFRGKSLLPMEEKKD